MTMQDLSQILLAAQSPDATARNSAEQQIASLEASDAGGFFQALSAHLSNDSNALVERKLAGTSAYTPFVWEFRNPIRLHSGSARSPPSLTPRLSLT